MTDIASRLARPDLLGLQPYAAGSTERHLVRLHTNEAPYSLTAEGLNRYPEPQPVRLLDRLADFYGIATNQLLLTRGSDDGIDLLVRCFCRAGIDRILVCPPTFAMYAQSARLQNAAVATVTLERDRGFAPDMDAIAATVDDHTRLVFLCSPNNPTGNLVDSDAILALCRELAGQSLVVVDEAYIEFADRDSLAAKIDSTPNLVVLRTLSKAFGLAGVRLGALVAEPSVIDLLRCALPPYPLATPTTDAALATLSEDKLQRLQHNIDEIRQQRKWLQSALQSVALVRRTWPSSANFLLTEVDEPAAALATARAAGILVRDVGQMPGLQSCLRITVGSAEQNQRLLAAWS
ncbi:MAG: histidinol-phosphate transaminase [Gammaproteobacteria bacterium]|nr:histidinol-phosphate transaminase [Gammaproteobacteria bacterium]